MKCVDYEIRVRLLSSGLYNGVAALRTHGLSGTSLVEVLVECGSGPCTTEELARRRSEERTRSYLINRFAHPLPTALAALRWSPMRGAAVRRELPVASGYDSADPPGASAAAG